MASPSPVRPSGAAVLRACLGRVTHVDVLDWKDDDDGYTRAALVASIAVGPDDDLPSLLAVREPKVGFACACMGGPLLALRDGREPLVTITLHHASSASAPEWRSHVRLVHGRALADWLASRGQPAAQRELDFTRDQASAQERAWARWEAATPPALRRHARALGATHVRAATRSSAVRALVRSAGSRAEAVRSLLRWYASGEGPWSGYTSDEDIPAELLHAFDASEVVGAVQATDDGLARLGAARLFAMDWCSERWADAAALPPALLAQLRPVVEAANVGNNLQRFDALASLQRLGEAPSGARVVGVPIRMPLLHAPVGAFGSTVYACADGVLRAYERGRTQPTDVATVANVRGLSVTREGDVLVTEAATARRHRVRRLDAGTRRWREVAAHRDILDDAVGWPLGTAWIAWGGRGRGASRSVMREERGRASLIARAERCMWLCADRDALYWVQQQAGEPVQIMRAPHDGGPVTALGAVNGADASWSALADAHLRAYRGALYWVAGGRTLCKMPCAGGAVLVAAHSVSPIRAFALWRGAPYVTTASPTADGFATFTVCAVPGDGTPVALHAYVDGGSVSAPLLATRRGLVWKERGLLWALPWHRVRAALVPHEAPSAREEGSEGAPAEAPRGGWRDLPRRFLAFLGRR